MKYIRKIYSFFKRRNKKVNVSIDNNSLLNICPTSKIENSSINVVNGTLTVGSNVRIHNYNITILNGEVTIGENSLLENGDSYRNAKIVVESGYINIKNNVRLRADVLVRFNGTLSIDEYTAINERTILRCDDKIDIGKFCMISYDCLIFDTNTHQILDTGQRRARTITDYPAIGKETDRPLTKPISIGNDCWIGQRCIILKGAKMENETILGIGSTLTHTIPYKKIAVGNPAIIK